MVRSFCVIPHAVYSFFINSTLTICSIRGITIIVKGIRDPERQDSMQGACRRQNLQMISIYKEVVIMLMPMLWNNNRGDDFWGLTNWDTVDHMFHDFWGNTLESTQAMKTDVIEEEKDYKVQAELPGFRKEDIHVDMKDGNLTISASHKEDNDKKDEKTGKYIRRERREASFQRSFYVGETVKPEDITAKYENGVLTLVVPKLQPQVEQKEEPKKIEIK